MAMLVITRWYDTFNSHSSAIKFSNQKKHEILPNLHPPPIQPHHIVVEFAPLRPSRWHGAWRFHGRLHGGVMGISLDLMVGGWDSMGVDWCLVGV